MLQARSFIGNDPFAVLYGDDVIIGEDPAIAQLCRAYDKYGKGRRESTRFLPRPSENTVLLRSTPSRTEFSR